ncbi:MAG: hypothetical protein Q3995_07960, partial [Eubacteriales bacterium]|nr:hypothetical protein [Eubacteriales bacterium]
SLSQFTGQNNKLLTDDLGVEWFMYVGSTMERTREFCQHMTAKKWVHVSEIPEILKGHIEYEGEVHKCKIYAKTKLPSGMIEGTNEDNFQVNVGGWNCRHQLVPVAAAAVPEEIRNKFETVKKPEPISEDLYKDKLAQFEEYLQNHKSGKVSANVAGIKKAAAEGNLDELNRHIAEAEATIAKNEASIKQKQEKAKMMKDKARLMKIDATKRIADGYIKDFKNIPGVDTSALKDAYKQGKWEDVRKEALKLALMKRSIIKQSMDAIKEANSLGGIDTSKLKSYLDARNLAKMQAETQNVANMVAKAKAAIDAMSDLFPNINTLRQQYSFSELEKAHKELDDVIQRWLSKYSYSSMDNAPLQHLKNKLLFELTNPTVRYSNPELIKKAIEEKMRLIDQQIEWNDLVTKVQSLKTFSTKLKAYKTALDKVDAALNSNDLAALRKAIDEAEKKQQEIVEKQIKRGGDTKTALNKEYKGGALGKDITPNVNAANMVSEDPYRGTYTNNIARMQGFDAPAKLVSESEFEMLAKACGEIFYRTVNPTNFKGKSMSSQEFASQLYVANLLELNGPGGRVYGDGMYVATASWDGRSTNRLTESRKQSAYYDSICYGNGQHTISEMTFTRKPKIIKQSELAQMWRNLTTEQKRKYGGTSSDYANTYGCALGYDAMYCSGPNYMVIWNRSIIAVKKQ